MKALSRFFIFLTLGFVLSHANATQETHDKYLYAKNYNHVLDLFLMNQCDYYFLAAYEYTPSTGKFTRRGLEERYPNIDIFKFHPSSDCNGTIPLELFNKTFSTNFTPDTPAFILYFDATYIPETGDYYLIEHFRPRAKRYLKLALSFDQGPLYIVKTPKTGMKP